MTEPARSLEQRKLDTLDRLNRDVDAWVATAGCPGGEPCLVPLSYLWDGSTLLFATPASNPTALNIQATGKVRLGIGPTRDVIVIDGDVEVQSASVPDDVGDAFAARTGFDPRRLRGAWLYFRVLPRRLQAWREANELAGRDLMMDGRWLMP